VNSKRTRIYSETYFFCYENADKLSHIRDNSDYNWIFWFSDNCNSFHFFWVFWFWKKKHREKIMSSFLSAALALSVKILFLTDSLMFHSLIFSVISMIQTSVSSETLLSDSSEFLFLISAFSDFLNAVLTDLLTFLVNQNMCLCCSKWLISLRLNDELLYLSNELVITCDYMTNLLTKFLGMQFLIWILILVKIFMS